MNRRNLYPIIAVAFVVAAVLNFISGSILAGVLFAIAAAIAVVNYAMNWRTLVDRRPADR